MVVWATIRIWIRPGNVEDAWVAFSARDGVQQTMLVDSSLQQFQNNKSEAIAWWHINSGQSLCGWRVVTSHCWIPPMDISPHSFYLLADRFVWESNHVIWCRVTRKVCAMKGEA